MWYNTGMTTTYLEPAAARQHLTAPWAEVSLSCLCRPGDAYPTLFARVSLDLFPTWNYGIFQNSRHAIFMVQQFPDGRAQVSMTSRHYELPKLRKATVASTEAALAKVQAWIDANV